MSAAVIAKRVLKRSLVEACSRSPIGRVITWRSTPARKQVALTFDDGPDEHYTRDVLGILEEFDARATFFILGQALERHEELVIQIADHGHEIGIHGYDHTLDDLPGQTIRTRELLADLGIETRLFRPPGGNLLPTTQLWMVRNGMRTVLWSYDLLDSMRHEGKVSARAPLVEMGPGDIALLHDDNPVCTDELPAILGMLRDRELAAVTVSELLG